MKWLVLITALLTPSISHAQDSEGTNQEVRTGLHASYPASVDAKDESSRLTPTALSNPRCITAAQCVLSPIIKYAPGWIGSVARSLEARLGDTVSLKDFGATGDARYTQEDDTQYLQTAMQFLCNTTGHGGNIFLPAGSYNLAADKGVSTPCGGIHISGAGIDASMIYITGEGRKPIFNFNAPINSRDHYFYGGEVDHLTVTGANTQHQSGPIFNFSHCEGCYINDVKTNFVLHAVKNFSGMNNGVFRSQFLQMLLGGIAIEAFGTDSECAGNVGNCLTRADVFKVADTQITAALNAKIETPSTIGIYAHDFMQTLWIRGVVIGQPSIGLKVDCPQSSSIDTCPGFIYAERLEVESNSTNDTFNNAGCMQIDNTSEVEIVSPQCYGSTKPSNLVTFGSSRFQSSIFKIWGGKIQGARGACVVSRVSDLSWSGTTIADCGDQNAASAYGIQLLTPNGLDGSGANISNMAFCSVGAGNTAGAAHPQTGLWIGKGVTYVTLGTSTGRKCKNLYGIDAANTDRSTYNLTGGNVEGVIHKTGTDIR